jgi:hypothetical protein
MAFFKMCLADNLQDALDCGGLPFLKICTIMEFIKSTPEIRNDFTPK